jgi:4'-phosphopantetheinyl transferase
VWRADLEAMSDDLGRLLCRAERARADRILRERHRQLWTRARGVLRALLGRYLQIDPRELRLATGEGGKPALLGEARAASAAASQSVSAGSPHLFFNLSHSEQIALYAFTHRAAVGVDVEVARRPIGRVARRSIDEVAIAARAFGSAEARRLQALEPAARSREFLRAWVRHEAELKRRGTGIGGSSASDSTPDSNGERVWAAQLDMGAGAAAAVALDRPPRELCCWDWPAQSSPGGARGS